MHCQPSIKIALCMCVLPFLFFKVCYVTTHRTHSKVSYTRNLLCKNSSSPSCVCQPLSGYETFQTSAPNLTSISAIHFHFIPALGCTVY